MDGSPNLSQIYSGGPGYLVRGVRILTACLGWMNGKVVLRNRPQDHGFDSLRNLMQCFTKGKYPSYLTKMAQGF